MNDQMNIQAMKLYVQYGAGNEAVQGWLNFDASPTLRIQKIPLIGRLMRSKLNCIFDDDVLYGDIVKGLPIKANSVDGLFCSHVLEHLSYADFSSALNNSFEYLKPGGVFRLIVPDLGYYINQYQRLITSDNHDKRSSAAIEFCKGTCFGMERSRSTFGGRLIEIFSNSSHRWMWDYLSLTKALSEHGFINIQRFQYGDSTDEMFLRPERSHQFGDDEVYGLALECSKPI
jgi:predicted SAM-dependent methyltransferase